MFLMLSWSLPAAVVPSLSRPLAATSSALFDQRCDADGNGVEDLLDRWARGEVRWEDLRRAASSAPASALKTDPDRFPGKMQPKGGIWESGGVRLVCLGGGGGLKAAVGKAAAAGRAEIIHDLQAWEPIQVLAVDAAGLAGLLAGEPDGRLFLDRSGTPALDQSRVRVGVPVIEDEPWLLGDDWSATVAILDSGCDTAHGDLGDLEDDDVDGPAPAVGDAQDWYAADTNWPLYEGYKVVGWKDVTDDFPEAQGPWDYHHHGTALASVAVGAGLEDDRYRGVATGGRLTVVKFYDFDGVWQTWAGDFLAACAWTLEHREIYRIRTVLCAVNWDQDLGLADAMDAFLAAGIVPVVAMGNDGADAAAPVYPASLPEVLSVGAIDDQGAVAAYSSSGAEGSGKPDLVAPGGGLLISAGRITAADNEPNDSYSGRVGTSLAAAHVAGAVYLLDEALLETGLRLPADRTSALTRMGVLKLTTAPVTTAETADGTAVVGLPRYDGHDRCRGWGSLRVDAAVEALRDPLRSGASVTIALDTGLAHPVAARRLITQPQIRYLVEAAPAAGLDVALEIVDPAAVAAGSDAGVAVRMDSGGTGVSEFAYFRPQDTGWMFIVVKGLAGSGQVVLTLHEADDFDAQGFALQLPGAITAEPNVAYPAPAFAPALVVPSRVTVDPAARSLNVLDMTGAYLPGWPVFLFPHGSSQGGMTLPLAWDLDGVPGDEIVVSADYGSVYFFTGSGSHQEVQLTFNRPLTPAVGITDDEGRRRVVVVDQLGEARAWSWGPVLEATAALGHALPLRPAVGVFGPEGAQAVVVAFADGHVVALDADLQPLPGWPVELGQDLAVAPVLADLDQDLVHEVILPGWGESGDLLRMRVLRADGQPSEADGTVIPAPEGGSWMALSEAVIAGGNPYGGPQIAVLGLAENGRLGAAHRWILGQATLESGGQIRSEPWSGLAIQATTDQSTLTLDGISLAAPVAYDFTGGGGTDVAGLVHVRWQDLLYGLTTIPGGVTGWFTPLTGSVPLAMRQPVGRGGPTPPPVGRLGSLVLPLDGDLVLRCQVVDAELTVAPLLTGQGALPSWVGARGDGRNSGSYPASASPSGTAGPVAPQRSLTVYPNPGSSRFRFKLEGPAPSANARVSIYDLRGRRVVGPAPLAADGPWSWTGRGRDGAPVAAGTYLAVVRDGAHTWSTRLVLTR